MYREQLLFVCSRNQWRSPTVAVLFKDLEVIEKRGGGSMGEVKRLMRLLI